MYWTLFNFSINIDIVEPSSSYPDDKNMAFSTPDEAARFLERFTLQWDNYTAAQNAIRDAGEASQGSSHQEVANHLARLVIADRLRLRRSHSHEDRQFRTSFGMPLGMWGPRSPVKVPAIKQNVESKKPADSWVIVKVVDDESNVPVCGLKLNIKLPDGHEAEYSMGATGKTEIRVIESGVCEVECDYRDTFIEDCFLFVQMGESPSGKKDQVEYKGKTEQSELYQAPTGSRIIAIDQHKVKDGETLDSVAKKYNMKTEDLAYFNFGTRDPHEINHYLYFEVGCEKKSDDGKSFVFESSDNSGIIYVLKKWTAYKLQTSQTHTIRVKKFQRPIRFMYQIDLDNPDSKNDTLTLETTDGYWKHTINLGELKETREDWVEVVFPKPPNGKRLNMIQDPKDGLDPFYVFQDVALEDMFCVDMEEI